VITDVCRYRVFTEKRNKKITIEDEFDGEIEKVYYTHQSSLVKTKKQAVAYLNLNF